MYKWTHCSAASYFAPNASTLFLWYSRAQTNNETLPVVLEQLMEALTTDDRGGSMEKQETDLGVENEKDLYYGQFISSEC